MPNWCENKLIVKSNGYESEFLKFMEQGRNKEIIKGKKVKVWRISNYMPTPERLLEENLSENEKKELINIYGFDELKITRIVFTHRINTLINCDTILVMGRGQIVQQGTFAELENSDGLFNAMLHGKTE